jgi:segregation and condensation protein B
MTEENVVTSKTAQELDEEKEIENLKKVEAALFIAARFLTLKDLIMLTDINPLMIKELLEKLIEKYNREDSAIEIIVKENMWKMDVRQEYVGMINKLATGTSEFTKGEQETLAVIAYKQPVKQSVVIKIRGNKAYGHIKKFIEIGLIFAKRAGHTLELKLSDDFFEYFHLVNRNAINESNPNYESNEESQNLQNINGKLVLEKKQGSEIQKESEILQNKNDEIISTKENSENRDNNQKNIEVNLNKEQEENPEGV